jgi:hypothetical protein
MNKFYIYFHINTFKNEIFYVGKGSGRRAFQKSNRNRYWINTTNKYEYDVIIIDENLTEEKAFELEIYYINKIGRKDLGFGTLVNMTNGGDGTSGNLPSEEQKRNHSIFMKGRPSWNKGVSITDERRNKISKKVINSKGEVFSSIGKAAYAYNIKRTTLNMMLLGVNKNKTDLSYE